MKFLYLIAIASLAFATGSNAQADKCGPHEVYQACASPCQENCLTRGFVYPCVQSCYSGCVCEDSYTRQGWDSVGGNGGCVQRNTCDALIRVARNGH